MLSLQASYAAPLILLAQNRQADRDRVQYEQDRARAERNIADTDYLTRELASIPIIAITASAMTNNRTAMLADGFDGYQTKPITLKDFFAEVERVLAPRK